jgi:hypothetical protein
MSPLLVSRPCRQGLPFRKTLAAQPLLDASGDFDADSLKDTDCLRGHTHVSFINDIFNYNSHKFFSDKSDFTLVTCNDNDNKHKHCDYSGYNLVNVRGL